MNQENKQRIIELFKKQNGYAQTRDLTMLGLSTKSLKELEDSGEVIKIKRGLYRWLDFDLGEHDQLVDLSKLVPTGVICLLSALSYHELTTYTPWEHYIAIHRDNRKPVLEEYPPIKFFYFSDEQFNLGIEELNVSGNVVKIYNMEKTICDILKYRKKIGADLVREALREYVQKKKKDITTLMAYSRKLGIADVTTIYLELLL